MRTCHVQLSCSLRGYVTSSYGRKEQAGSGAVRVALGQSRRRQRALDCRARAQKMVQEAENSASGALEVLGITRRVEETIIPTPSDHPELHQLSPLDQLFPRHVAVPILLFFTADAGGGSAGETVQSLKRSLREALAVFYPMAGRLVQRPDSSAAGFDVSCLDQGALFSEAWADGPLSSFDPAFQPHPAFHLLSPLPFSNAPDALLYIQVTHFTCGGFCICFQERHILSDGVSLFHFLQSLVEILNGKRVLTLYPYMDSSVLEDAYKLNNGLTPSSQYGQNLLETSSMAFDSSKTVSFTSKIFHFTRNSIATLKNEAKLVRHPTSYECLVAYLWQNVARVNQYPLHESLRLAFPINIRKRLRPSLPQGYFGNGVLTGFTYGKMEDLVAKEGLSYATSLIRDGTSTMKSDYIKLALDWLTKQQSPPPLFFAAMPNKLVANTWIQIPFGDLNFPWGKPYCARTHYDPNILGEFILLIPSSFGKDHFDVQVNLQHEHMLEFQDLITKVSSIY